ncbi:hypothetical protein HYW18_01170 [Candidatus Uhrbacteria bacterium]|nr:hypothetical protein [Candidatus Uhrbacteria bacterium]
METILLEWEVPEYQHYDRSRRWYVWFGIALAVLVGYAIFTANFTFAIILVMGGIIMFLSTGREPAKVPFAVTPAGFLIGEHFHPYHEFRNFAILYNPPHVKSLYLTSDKRFRPVVTISLQDMDPNTVRETLMGYLPEDLNRTEETLTEMVARVAKL